jgi:uncharacterized protein (TIGR00251 family)
MIALSLHERGVVVPVKAQPGAKRNGILGERAQALRVAVTAPPERGLANEAIAEVLAQAFGVKSSQVAVLTGETSRDKRFLIAGADLASLCARVTDLVQNCVPKPSG